MAKKNYKRSIFFVLSLAAGILLVLQHQNIAKAASLCPGVEQCPSSSDHSRLLSCHPADIDGTATESLCSSKFVGRRETCGSLTTYYCCNGTSWTTNLTACATPIPSASPSPSPRQNPWDVDQNGVVNIVDIGLVIDNYAKSPSLDPRTDVNGDGVIDIVDIGIVIDHYGL